jgi:predicted DsbA family dithiol-disulfide isomerase
MAFKETERGRKRLGAGAIFGWTAFFLVLAAILVFGWKTWYFADKMRRGDILALPQFESKLSAVSRGSISTFHVEPGRVEVSGRPEFGDTDSPKLTIVAFMDFECPYSAEAANAVRAVTAAHSDEVKLIFRHYPLSEMHSSAELAAEASECAWEQGKFWSYHDKLFANQKSLGLADLERYATEVGMDGRQFNTCLAERRYSYIIEEDMAAAETFDLSGTPVFFFNGDRVEGSVPESILEAIVDMKTR